MRWVCRAIWTLAVVLATARSGAADVRRSAILTLVINGVPAGTQIVYLEAGDAWLPVDALRKAGLAPVGGAEQIAGVTYVSARSLNVTFVIEEDAMAIRLVARAEDLPDARIDLAGVRRPAGMTLSDDTSLYVNYGVHAIDTRIDGFADTGLRRGALLAYTSAALLADDRIARGLSNVTVDDRPGLRRVVAGDQVVNAGPLAGGGVVGGVHLIRSFELDPYVVTAPGMELTGSVLVPSTADIYVNGVLVRREQLAPGRYTLANLPLTRGAGEARVVLRDALGRQQEVASGYYVPGGLLRPGLTDYHLVVGALREHMGIASFDYGGPVAIARYQRGLRAWLTVGVRAAATLDQIGAGASLTAGLPFGRIDGALGWSTDRGVRGAAASLGWSFTSRRGGLSIAARRVGDRYATIDSDRDADRTIAELRVQASFPVRRGLGLSAQLAAAALRDSGWSNRGSLAASVIPSTGITLSLTVGRSDEWQQPRRYDAMASLGINLAAQTRGSVTQQRHGDRDQTELEVHRSLGGEPGVGYRALVDADSDARATGAVQAQTAFGRYEAGYSYGPQGGTVELSAAGGLAVIGGRWFASTPIDRSFGLVRVGVPDVRIGVENHTVGRTDERGDLFVPNLQPNYGNNISINAGDLPFGRQLPAAQQVVAPAAGGGVIVTFAAAPLHLVRGTVQVEGPTGSTIPAYGELTVAGALAPFVSPISGEGAFELDGVRAGHHAATVEWSGGHCAFDLAVGDSDQPILEAGTFVCHAHDPVAAP